MDDDLPEKFLDFGSSDQNSFGEPLWKAEAFKLKCERWAAAMKYGKVDLRFQLMYAMWLLGPVGWPPPQHVCEGLLRAVLVHLPADKRQERLFDAVIAFGCGWRREIKPEATGWEARWPGGLRSLTALVERSLKSADYKLRRAVGLGRPDEFKFKPGSGLEAVAYHLAMQLARPFERLCLKKAESLQIVARENAVEIGKDVDVPPGGKYVLDVGGQGASIKIKGVPHAIAPGTRLVVACGDGGMEIRLHPENKTFRLKPGESAELLPGKEPAELIVRECTCGSIRCAERHRLESWNPEFSLIAFVAAAVKGLKPEGGNTLPGLVSLQQGMYFQHLNRGIEALLGGKQHRLQSRLRLVSAAAKQCTCGAVFMDDSCPECGAKFDPVLMKIVKKKAFLILKGVGPEDQTRLEQLGKSYVRKPFLRCNRKDAAGKRICDNHFEFFDSLLVEQAKCHECHRPLYREEELKKLIFTAATSMQQLKKLQAKRRRLVKKKATCPHCGSRVHKVPLQCPVCRSCKLGQNLVFLYERKPPALIIKPREAASGDGLDGDGDQNSGPDDEYPEEVDHDA